MRKTILILIIASALCGTAASHVLAAAGTLTLEGSTASFSGAITTGDNQPIKPPSGYPLILQYKSGFNSYTDGIIIRNDGNVGIGITAGGNIPSKLTVAGTVELTSGNIKFPDATIISTAATIPAGAVIFWDGGTTCPAAWSELTTARGFTIVGLPSAGTLSGTVGTAFTNLEDRTHTHTGPSHTHTYTDMVAHTHAIDPPATTSTADSHTNNVDPPITTSTNPGTHTHTIPINQALDGSVRFYATDTSGSSTANSSSAGSHSHTVDVASFTSGADNTSHTHSTDIASFTSGSTGVATGTTAASGTASTGAAATSNVMPYTQLLICEKS